MQESFSICDASLHRRVKITGVWKDKERKEWIYEFQFNKRGMAEEQKQRPSAW